MKKAPRLVTLLAAIAVFLAAPAVALAFDIAPPSGTVQAGDQLSATVTSLAVAPDGSSTCLEAYGTSSIYLTALFSPTCGSQAGWSSTMTIRTIPATPSGDHTLVIALCPIPGCQITAGNENKQPIDTRNWVITVTPAPVPVQTITIGPTTPAPTQPAATQPAASPTPVKTPTRPAPTPTPTRATPTPTPTPVVTSTPATPVPLAVSPTAASPSSTQTSSTAGQALGLVLDHPTIAPGGRLGISATGCNPDTTATVSVAGVVTQSATAGADGKFNTSVKLPSALKAGRYQVIAMCGPDLSVAVDVATSHRALTVGLVVLGIIVALALGLVAGRFTRRPAE